MRKLATILVALATVSALFWLLRTEPTHEQALAPAADPLPAAAHEATPPSPEPQPLEPASSSNRAPLAAPENAPAPGPTFRLTGRVLDTLGRPLPQVRAQLISMGEPWIDGVRTPPALATRTRGSGHFELTGPLPTARTVALFIEPDAFHTAARRIFTVASSPLLAGTNDVGDIVLESAGSVEGYVEDERGMPLEGARINVGGRTDASGHYRIDHVRVGRLYLSASKPGFRNGPAVELEIQPGGLAQAPVIALATAPTIEGLVMDDAGEPLAGVALFAFPAERGGSGSVATSEADGAFSLPLPEDQRYAISAELEGFLPLFAAASAPKDGATANSYCTLDGQWQKAFAGGTRNIVVHLARAPEVTFRIVERGTSKPIERFGLATDLVHLNGGVRSSRKLSEELPVVHHTNGIAVLAGQAERFEYAVSAPGFAPRRGPILFDTHGEATMTIELVRAARIVGRLLNESGAPATPSITLRIDRSTSPPPDAANRDPFAGRPQELRGEPDGRFAIGDLAAGLYQLTLRTAGAAPLTLAGVRVSAGQVLDLGDLVASPSASIRGQLVARGSVAGIEVALGNARYAESSTAKLARNDGSFEFTGLEAGVHWLWIETRPGVLAEAVRREIQLSAGQQRDVRIDLTEDEPFELEVLVRSSGSPLEGLMLFAASDKTEHFPFIGTTDSRGIARGEIPPIGEFTVDVRNDSMLRAALDGEPHIATPGGHGQFALELEVGELVIALDFEAGLVEKLGGRTNLYVQSELGGARGATSVSASDWSASDGLWSAPIGLLEHGTYVLRFATRLGPAEATVEIRTGETSVCRFDLAK